MDDAEPTTSTSSAMLAMIKVEVRQDEEPTEESSKETSFVAGQASPEKISDSSENDKGTESIPTDMKMQTIVDNRTSESVLTFTKSQISPPISVNNRLLELRTNVEDKSHLLSSAWNELYNLLGEYKAELFSKEVLTQKYEGINDVNHLKSELLEKDNEIQVLRNQLDQIHQQNEEIHRLNEQCHMDVSVKDSLLKKYQEDLLHKEAALMTSNTKISRLESRIRALELRGNPVGFGDGSPARKIMRTQVTPGRVMPSPASRPMQGGTVGRLTPGTTGRLLPGSASRFTPGMSSRPMQSLARRRIPAPPTQVARAPVLGPRPSPTTKPPIVCIEVDDDDEIQEIREATHAVSEGGDQSTSGSQQDSLYMGVWPDHQDENNETSTDTNPGHSMPGTSGADSYSGVDQPLMMSDSQSGYSGQDDSMEGAWPVEMTSSGGDMSALGQGQNQSPSNKKNTMKKEIVEKEKGEAEAEEAENEEIFEGMNMNASITRRKKKGVRNVCDECGQAFTQASNLGRHIKTIHRGIPRSDYASEMVNLVKKPAPRIRKKRKFRPEGYLCGHCGLIFNQPSNLARHIKYVHKGAKRMGSYESKQLLCQKCGVVYKSSISFRRHMKAHIGIVPTERYPCVHCDRNFGTRGNLNKHVRLCHSEADRIFVCEKCDTPMRRKEDMKTHVLRHKPDRDSLCPHCPKSFLRRTHLKKHMDAEHKTTDETLEFNEVVVECFVSPADVLVLQDVAQQIDSQKDVCDESDLKS